MDDDLTSWWAPLATTGASIKPAPTRAELDALDDGQAESLVSSLVKENNVEHLALVTPILHPRIKSLFFRRSDPFNPVLACSFSFKGPLNWQTVEPGCGGVAPGCGAREPELRAREPGFCAVEDDFGAVKPARNVWFPRSKADGCAHNSYKHLC